MLVEFLRQCCRQYNIADKRSLNDQERRSCCHGLFLKLLFVITDGLDNDTQGRFFSLKIRDGYHFAFQPFIAFKKFLQLQFEVRRQLIDILQVTGIGVVNPEPASILSSARP